MLGDSTSQQGRGPLLSAISTQPARGSSGLSSQKDAVARERAPPAHASFVETSSRTVENNPYFYAALKARISTTDTGSDNRQDWCALCIMMINCLGGVLLQSPRVNLRRRDPIRA